MALVVASLGCAGGGEPSSGSAFDPTPNGSETGAMTASTGPGDSTSAGASDVTGQPPPDGSCCQVAPTPGCGNPETETCVCTLDPACCQQTWTQDCVAMALDPCGDPACDDPPPGTTGEPSDGSSGSSSGGPPVLSCDELAMQEGWMLYRCQAGDIQCNDMGTPTTDCDYCCEYCGEQGDVSCGGLAAMMGWGAANCEWNGNGACNGMGTPTCDCNFCCEVGG
jgi:hypothetical protein